MMKKFGAVSSASILQDEESDIELDGYETAVSSEDFENDDDGYVDNNEGDLPPNKNPLSRINIHEEEYSESYLPDVQMRDTEDPFKHTELVLKFNHNIDPIALRWFLKRVTAKKSQGGAELLLKREPYSGPKEGLVVHVTAAGWRLLEVAEKLEIKKMDYNRNIPRAFKVAELSSFLDDSMEISDILTPAEKQIVVMYELKNFFVHPGEHHLPGYKHIKLTVGQSIFHIYTSHQLIISYFALHQEDELNKLDGKWFWQFFTRTPYEDIRSYFGDSTCLYFNFLAYYTYWLTIPAVIGLIMRFLPENLFYHLVLYFSILNMLFVTIFLIMWQRYQSRLTYMWGTLKMNHWEEPRDNYRGVLALDPVTGRLQRRYPYYMTALKTYGVSLPIAAVCCAGAIWFMHWFVEWEIRAKKYSEKAARVSKSEIDKLYWTFAYPYFPAIVYASIVFLLTKLYRWMAYGLTEWENHRTETQFERHLVQKMVLFEVANAFGVLFYSAFAMENSLLLQQRLFVLLGIFQVFMTLEQILVPMLFHKGQVKMHEFLDNHRLTAPPRNSSRANEPGGNSAPLPFPGLENVPIQVLDKHDKRVLMSKVEAIMAPYEYEADFDEYLNLYLQFGYIFLFSSVYPPAAAFAVLSNLVLLSTSLYKRREVYQRALARRVSSIGAWLKAFEFMSVLSVMTNCALLVTNDGFREMFPHFEDMEWIIISVLIEHAVLFLQHLVKKVSPKIPYKVKVALAKWEFRSGLALKREQAQRTRRRITQFFQPINQHLRDKLRNISAEQEEDEQTTESPKSKDGKQSTSKPTPAVKNVPNISKGRGSEGTRDKGKTDNTTNAKKKK